MGKTQKQSKKMADKYNAWKEAIRQANHDGYQKGWDDFENKRPFGSALSGAVGYYGGAKARIKHEKIHRAAAKKNVNLRY